MGSLFYAFDLIHFVRTGAVRLPVAFGFVAGIVVCGGLARGVWRREPWARVVLVWLAILIIGSVLFSLPFAFLLRPAGTALNLSAFVPLILLLLGCVLTVRYLSQPETRRLFKSPATDPSL